MTMTTNPWRMTRKEMKRKKASTMGMNTRMKAWKMSTKRTSRRKSPLKI
jgi:hypothetical protein